jgi:CBS domain-containing protein
MTRAGAPPETERKEVNLFKAVGGQQIIRLILETKPSDYDKILWYPCTTTTMWLGALEYSDNLEKLLRIFDLTGFGDARVNAHAPPHALITLDEVVSLYRERKLKCNLEVKEIASHTLFVDPDTNLLKAMKTMVDKRIRRLFLHGEEGAFVSDRNILAFLFSPKALAVEKHAPDSWTDVNVSSIPTTKASFVSPQARVEEVGSMPEPGRDVFLLSDGASLVSRWDLVMKPWKEKQLSLSL